MAEASLCDPSSFEFSCQEQSMLDCRVWLVIPINLARGQSFINSVILYAYDAADATVLEFFYHHITASCTHEFQECTALNHSVLAKKWCISPMKALNMINVPYSMVSTQCCIHPYLPHNVYSDTLFANIMQIFATDFGLLCSFLILMKLKRKPMKH